MIARVDAVIHIASVSALIADFAAHAPEHLDAEGQGVTGFDRTPIMLSGDAGLVYVRLPADRVGMWSQLPGVTVLAQAAYAGPQTPDAVYAALFADPAMVALYDAVYDRAPVLVDDGQGGTVLVPRPERIGQMG